MLEDITVQEHENNVSLELKTNKRNNTLMRYSQQLAMLSRLYGLKLIDEQEYQAIKATLMKDYHIKSDLTA